MRFSAPREPRENADRASGGRGGHMQNAKIPRLLVATLAVLALVGAACGDDDTETSAGAPETTEAPEQAASGDDEEVSDEVPPEFQDLVLVGASSGGGGYTWVTAASQILNDELGTQFSVQAGAPAENALLLQSGEINTGMTSVRNLREATDDPEAYKTTNIRTLWTMFSASLHVLVDPSSDAEKLSDLKGETLAGGIRGGDYDVFVDALECGGMSESDFQLQAIGKNEASSAYIDGNVAGWVTMAPAPTPALVEVIESRRGAKLIPVDQEIIDCMVDSGEFSATEIPAGVYPGVDETITTLAQWFVFGVREDVPDAVTYNIARVLHEKHDDLVSTFRGATTSTVENTVQNSGFELHPGVQKYFEEIGAL
jgi:TRAP transporter TAXI family solute receptor